VFTARNPEIVTAETLSVAEREHVRTYIVVDVLRV
jgi:hypothetical protein